MKVKTTITETVKISVSHRRLFNLFVNTVYGDAKAATGKDQTFYKAFGSLVGISDVDAVLIANVKTKKEERITVTEFRKWLPTVFAEFARAMLETAE